MGKGVVEDQPCRNGSGGARQQQLRVSQQGEPGQPGGQTPSWDASNTVFNQPDKRGDYPAALSFGMATP